MTNPKGESTGALYGFIRSLFKIIKEETPKYLVAVFDGPDNTKSRKKLYSEYKIHREKMPEDLHSQLHLALEFCKIAGIPTLFIPGVEADDVMGSLAKRNEQRGIKTFLCSSDKDLCQLVSDQSFVLNIHKENFLMNREEVKKKFDVFPEQIIDLLAMMGDASDNIPGLPGIGPKTAASLLNRYQTLEKVYTHLDELKGKQHKIFKEGHDLVKISKKLATIQTDVKVPDEDDFYRLKNPDLQKIKDFYKQMHFMTLLKELHVSEKSDEELELDLGLNQNKARYTLINDTAKLKELLDQLSNAPILCIDTETTSLDPMQAQLIGIGISDDIARGWYIPLNGDISRNVVLDILTPFIADKKRAFFGHNIKYDLHVLEKAGIQIGRVDFDTMVASYLIAPHQQRHNLDTLALQHFEKVKTPISNLIGKGKKQISIEEVPLETVASYCCEDVDYTFRLRRLFELQLEKEKLTQLFQTIEIPLLSVLFRMEKTGIFLDPHPLKTMQTSIEKRLHSISIKIYDLAGEKFNLNSPKQLGVILFEKLKIRPVKKTATGYSTSADTLEALKKDNPIVDKILNYRGMEKLRSTYIMALPQQINPKTGRIHCTFHQTVTATGRLSCADPNLQNIPIRTEEGRKIRTAFKPKEPGKSLLSADYSQIELRLLAHFSEDPTLIKAFKEGEDIHAYTASLVYGVSLKQVTAQMRYFAKTVNFGILYGQSAFGLSKELGISKSEAKTFIDTYFKRYSKIQDYLEFCKETVRKKGYSLTILSRKRYIPEIDSKNVFIRQAAERLAVNTPLQGSSADLIKLAMISLDDKLKNHLAKMLLQIHDELLFETPDNEVKSLSAVVRRQMEGVAQLKIPLVVDISIGKNWGEC